jgi:hypothetical protein
MKFISMCALAAVTVLSASNFASAASCARPAKFSVPDGKTASDDQMKAAQAKLTPYAQAMSTYLHCLSDEIKSGKDEYDQVSAEWKTQSDNFRNTPAKAQ